MGKGKLFLKAAANALVLSLEMQATQFGFLISSLSART
jgi:hypothetical protein